MTKEGKTFRRSCFYGSLVKGHEALCSYDDIELLYTEQNDMKIKMFISSCNKQNIFVKTRPNVSGNMAMISLIFFILLENRVLIQIYSIYYFVNIMRT